MLYLLSDQVVALVVLEELVHLDDVGVVLRRGRVRWLGEAYRFIIDFHLERLSALTISFRILISLNSIRFSSSSMWLLRRTFTARCAPDSLCTHMRTSPKAPVGKR